MPHDPRLTPREPSMHREHLLAVDQYVDDLHFEPPRMRLTLEFAEKTWISLKLTMSFAFETPARLTRIANDGMETLNGSAVPVPGTTSPKLTTPLLTSSTLMNWLRSKQLSERGHTSIVRIGELSCPDAFAGYAWRALTSSVGV